MGQDSNNKKKIIIVAVAILLFVLAIVIVILIVSRSDNSKKNNESLPVETSKTAFNEFYHYLTEAKDDDTDVSLKDIQKKTPYLQKNKVSNTRDYLKKLDEKYFAFINVYSKTNGKNLPADLYAFCYGYYMINEDVKDLDLVELYREEGIDEARNEMFETIKPIGDPKKTNNYLDEYIVLQRTILEAELAELPSYDASGCISVKNKLIDGCRPVNDEQFLIHEQTAYNAIDKIIGVKNNLSGAARAQLETLYKEIYNIKNNEVTVYEK